MRRTILGIYIDPATSPIQSTTGKGSGRQSIQVEETQQDLAGADIYHGEAAYIGHEERTGPVIKDDGSIIEDYYTVEVRKQAEWFAIPDGHPGFLAVDASDTRYLQSGLAQMTGGWIAPANYYLPDLVEYVQEEYDATVWQVVWSEKDEAGTYYPGPGSDESITEHGLQSIPKQVGFSYFDNGQVVRGTCAASGYLELYSPEGWGFAEMARFLQEDVMQFAYVQDVGWASEIAEQTETRTCEACGRESTTTRKADDGALVCYSCRADRDEDGGQATLPEAAATEGGGPGGE